MKVLYLNTVNLRIGMYGNAFGTNNCGLTVEQVINTCNNDMVKINKDEATKLICLLELSDGN